MKFSEYLPLGSVVLLENGIKKIVIIGYFPTQHTDTGEVVSYEYLGIPYPEGFVGMDSGLLFNHKDIRETVSVGYSNEEREVFVKTLQDIIDSTKETVDQAGKA